MLTATQTPLFFFDPARLAEMADKHRRAYQRAEPFPHAVIDNFLPEDVLLRVLEEFPEPEQADWVVYDNPAEKKLMGKDETQWGEQTRLLLYQLNSSVVVNFLEALTGIERIIPDPHFWGGGLHQIKRGGFLKVHADFNRHAKLDVDRRLNLLIYLNRDWKEEYGGHLELWNREMTQCVKKILPVFNRCVVFSTTDFSFHGHPDPVNCPEGQTRKSLALYYYTNGRPPEELSGVHSTLFRPRTGEAFEAPPDEIVNEFDLRSFLLRLTPPILVDARRYVKRKLGV